ncbi:bifunctional 4-hydroxy-2-oxoglutarate aldolase/2-dehydro-3-deoxy-phosphogluconate aldolase [Fusibacter paucivorans]|uniref:Bifunctional 4-hydroxy-2-oxoglutarate aldolase/2-dehydro-3-deoxy-phosphogluconate aldolase n=1 Tax=Fusibacter paucivorans TaxID=76009 RepID=A0ABS5PR23_9FIRM|nr:bifunctional 4-hydroxy-2-oxoglutarate aldolase/2-dehydro-3-deoxy-phosphogluconate aldolase [Fusibacter paucivorans]MBS7527605.1 bifunctional 4-hydroxy-2-oxoglutarate aldolase/2-dehydro-3-deoxy-phosphogluconate aldolase [Fusibacter paucivorans]
MRVAVTSFPKVTAILRGYDLEKTDLLLELLAESSFKSVEIALNTPNAKSILSAIIPKYSEKLAIGAGTVLTLNDLKEVVALGVDFVLSPVMFSKEMCDYCKKNGVISIPGAYSPTEISSCFNLGADIVKVFPAENVGTRYFKNLQSPLGKLPLMAVGGVTPGNANDYLNEGATFLGIGSAMFNKEDVTAGNVTALRQQLAAFAEKIGL